jgi:colicin import membrane protein
MRRRKGGARRPHVLHHPASPEKGGLWAAGIFSLLLHITLIIFLTVGLKPTMTKMKPSFYRVTIRPYAPQGDGSPLGSSPAERPGPAITKSAPPPIQKTVVEKIKPAEKTKSVEKTKPAESEKGHKTVEGLKSPQKKSEKKVATAEKEDLSEKQKESLKNLHEELENIRRKAALEEIKKKILRREELEKEVAREASAGSQSQGAQGAIASGSGTGSGTGTGSTGSPTGGSPWGSSSGGSALESRLSDYYDSIWAKIKKEWTLPENLPKGRTTLETTIVIVIDREGKIQKSWFERKSGNSLFDQRAMRAIKKAEPLPPIPKEFSDATLEMGFRFHPD